MKVLSRKAAVRKIGGNSLVQSAIENEKEESAEEK
jgi:hypothetical protein